MLKNQRNIILILTGVVIVAGGIFAWQYLRIMEKETIEVPGQKVSVADWTGIYEYGEFAPPNQTWVYKLEIYKEEGQLKARLDIDGFQTLFRIQAITKERNKNLDIIFDSYRPENSFPQYQQEDLLFSLQKISEENYKIIWSKLKSNLLEPGVAEFKKVVDETADWKTYRNEEYGFEIKYPKEWFIRENTAYDMNSRKEILRKCREEDPSDPYAPLGRGMGDIKFENRDYPRDFGEMGYFPPNSSSGAILEISIECNKTIPQDKNLLLLEGIDRKIDPWAMWKSYNANHNGLYYSLNLFIYPQQNITSQEKEKLVENFSSTFNQMLSTFRFLE